MNTIVITGSTRGIGFGLAENFLKLGQQVVISGQSQQSVDQALEKLTGSFPPELILGVPCDMREFPQVLALWKTAAEHFEGIDIWINNAGVGHPQTDFWDLKDSQISTLVDTNMTGAMFGARVALAGFMEQGRGAFYNMEGLGSDGRSVEGLTLYGTTKRGLNYLTDNLSEEVKGTGVIVGALSPGMVVTEFLTGQYQDRDSEDWERAKGIFNILADLPETVTPFLAEQVLLNKKNGARIRWLTGSKILWRFLTASFKKRDLFQDLDI